ncbi:MAG: TolC family protein [Proteobacteria bacterium]|nr:TolC family protein [Pseudomonadota bacterium]
MMKIEYKLKWVSWATFSAVIGISMPAAGKESTAAGESTAIEPDHPAATPKETPDTTLSEFELPEITAGPNMTLAEALLAADRRNVSLAVARLEIEKTEAQLSMAWAALLPRAQGKIQFMHRDHEDTASFATDMVIMPQEDLKGSLDVGMPLINVQSWYTVSAAKKGIELARMTVEQGRQQILFGVAQAYYMALMARSLINMYETQVKSATHHLKVAKARFNAGTGLRIDVIRAETDLTQARQELLSSHLSFDNARDVIGVLTRTKGLPTPVEAPPIEVPVGSNNELADQAIRDRRDIKAKGLAVELKEKDLDASWMQFLPTLDAGWQLQYQFTEPGDMGSNDRSRWVAMFTLSVPIYNQHRYGDLDHKRAALRQAILQKEDTQQNASMEVRKVRRNYLTALSSVNIAERQEKLAKEALTLTEASYNAGTGSSLDVTDARRRASEAEINLASKRLQAQIALLSLLSAIGEDILKLSK